MGTFYRSFLLFSFGVTVSCLSLFWENGTSIFMVLFWCKIATLGLTYYFIDSYKRKEYYYYLNLGISKVMLWTVTLCFDFALFLFLIILIYQFR
jgi:CDP-diglyceride synthetase